MTAQTPQQPHQQPNAPGVDSGAIGRLTEAQGDLLHDTLARYEAEIFAGPLEPVVESIVRAHVTAALAEVESVAHYWERTPALRRGTAAAELRRALHRAHDYREGVGR